jgi:hypothetical protein
MTNADKLREIMKIHNLTSRDVSILLDVSIKTVRAWRIHSDSSNHRPMKNRDLDFLNCKIFMKGQ